MHEFVTFKKGYKEKMIKYELKKNLIYNKGLILVLLLMLQVIASNVFNYKNGKDLEIEIQQYYYNNIHGKISDEKVCFMIDEEKKINEFEEKSELYLQQFKSGEITDEQYVTYLEDINKYHYRTNVFENVKEYVNYLKLDESREYIDEEHINQYLDHDIPYLFIIVIILIVTISFQNEESMHLLIKTSIVGKNKLIKIKCLTLIGINSMLFIVCFLIDFLLKYNMTHISELLVPLESTRMFEGTHFRGGILAVTFSFFVMRWLAVIILTCLTSLLCIKTKIGARKLCILEIGIYVVTLLMFTYSRWLYYLSPIGFFNPKRYFFGEQELNTGDIIYAFSMKELLIIFLLTILILIIVLLKRKKIYQIPTFVIICLLLTGCQNEKEMIRSIDYNNNNGFNINEEIAVYTVENQMIDFEAEECYEINRNVLKNIEIITNGYMYNQYLYFVAIDETEMSIQRLNTKNFEQKEIYRSSLYKYDVFGNIISSSRNNKPLQIYVEDKQIYIVYYNRVEVLAAYNDTELLFEGEAYIVKIEDEKLYYINDKNQLMSFNLNTHEKQICLKSLISNAYIDDQYIYFIKLKDEKLYRFERPNKDEELIINKDINFFQIGNNKIYYTTIGGKGINIYNYKSKQNHEILKDIKIYTFSMLGNKTVFTAYDDELHKISWYYFNDNNVYKISEN